MSTEASTPIVSQTLPEDPALLKDVIKQLLAVNSSLQHKNESLQQQLEQLRRRLFGQKSEKFDPNQQLLFADWKEPAACDTPMSPTPPAENADAEKPKVKGHGRKGLNPKLRREERRYVLAEEERKCPCGGLCQKFGEDVSEQLDYIPASLFVVQHVREKYACPACHDHVKVADKPEQPIAKGLPGAGLVAQVITCKYADHIPLNRFEHICKRQGVELSRSTMCDWMKAAADLLTPLYNMMASLVLLSKSVHTDDTKVPWQNPETPGKTQTARMWLYLGDDEHPFNVFDFTPTWSRDGPKKFLAGRTDKFQGILQADALSGYDAICAELGIVRAGCWAHARRHFFDAKDSAAALVAEALAHIGRLYAVEKEAREEIVRRELAGDAADALRRALRQEKAVCELTSLRNWLDAQSGSALPKSPFGKAVQYALNHWYALTLYVQHGFLAIDNNAAERALRPIAVGRNNRLFVGSQTGGRTAAVLFTFTSTCRRLNLDPFAYLRNVLTTLAAGPLQPEQLAELLPHRWSLPAAS